MSTCTRISWTITAFLGTAAGVLHFLMADRWAKVEATRELKFEMPPWWMIGESIIIGVFVILLIGGVSAGIRRIMSCRDF